ncbi:unnamed protein product [Debaryomyces tyrocola]|nr:unnamed protein product [Debaryomyces tyrocola]CUM55987.1 unnamed protein product [Debaryomyces tyrocola]
MNNNTFRNNIRRYILGDDEDTGMDIDIDIAKFEITKFDYRKIFDNRAIQNVSYQEILRKMFEIENVFDLDMDHVRLHYKDHPDKWKELFIFFCVMPFTEYEFQGKDGNLLNPDTLHIACPSEATDNLLIGTFSDIEFESLNQELPNDRLAANLQCILRIDLFSNAFSEYQRKRVITKLLGVCFKQDYKLVKHIGSKAEATYRDNFLIYLFKPISDYVSALFGFEIEVEERNTDGQTGVQTRVPHTTNDLFYSHPDIVAYTEKIHCRSLAIVEVKKLPLLKGNKVVSFNDSKMVRFFVQVVAEMFSNHTNKGMLTDSYTTILVEIDIERSLEVIKHSTELLDAGKPIALNYKILDCPSSGLTLRGGLISFIYEAFNTNGTRLNEIKRGLDKIYKYIRKTDEEYLTYIDGLADKYEAAYRNFCIDAYRAKEQRLYLSDTSISLGEFAAIDVQSGFTFNSQLFKVSTKDVIGYLKEDVDVVDQFIVKVFDPIKAKRDHDSYTISKTAIFGKCRRAYLCEKTAYEKLIANLKFNSIYIDQECVFGKFNIGEHYHALGPFLILKYLDKTTCPLDEETYKKAEEQLEIIHSNQIIHGDINLRNILYCDGKVYFIDFGYSNYDDNDEKRSRPVSANEATRKSEHRELCEVFGQPIPEKYRY